jgi:hypothetical protein
MLIKITKQINPLKLSKELRAAGVTVIGIIGSTENSGYSLYVDDSNPADVSSIIEAHVPSPMIDWEAEWAEATTLELKIAYMSKKNGLVKLTDQEIADGRLYY